MSSPTIIQVATEAELNQAIATVDAASTGSFLIQLTTNITEGTDTGASITFNGKTLSAPPDLYALNLQSGVDVTIDGQGNTLSGAGLYRGIFAYAGAVTIQNLSIDNTLAQGGAGFGGGGGGAGLGGGLFVGSGAQVTLSDVSFSTDQAQGGSGSSGTASGGGGGLGGSGGLGGGGVGADASGGTTGAGGYGILPVCIKAGALGTNMPVRDLWISPHHAMYFSDDGGVLIEAKDLVNGTSIVQAARVDTVEYFHIELETHDVIIAEGALSETYLDDDNRGMFHNALEYETLYAGQGAWQIACYCAPRLEDGYTVEDVRRRIAARHRDLCRIGRRASGESS
jgi:hypothetical protein